MKRLERRTLLVECCHRIACRESHSSCDSGDNVGRYIHAHTQEREPFSTTMYMLLFGLLRL